MKYMLGNDTPLSEAILVVRRTGPTPDCVGCETMQQRVRQYNTVAALLIEKTALDITPGPSGTPGYSRLDFAVAEAAEATDEYWETVDAQRDIVLLEEQCLGGWETLGREVIFSCGLPEAALES